MYAARERGLALNDISWNPLTTLVPTKHTNEDVSCIPSRYTKHRVEVYNDKPIGLSVQAFMHHHDWRSA